MHTSQIRVSVAVLAVQVALFVLAPAAFADRRPSGMEGGTDGAVTLTQGFAPGQDAEFYRSVERRLDTAQRSLRMGDLPAARLGIRWAETRLTMHGQPVDHGFSRDLTMVLSYLRHYQIGPGQQLLMQVTRRIHALGWGGQVAVTVPLPARTMPALSPSVTQELDQVITTLKNRRIDEAREGLRKATTKASDTNALDEETVRSLRSLDLHFDTHADDPEALIESLEAIRDGAR